MRLLLCERNNVTTYADRCRVDERVTRVDDRVLGWGRHWGGLNILRSSDTMDAFTALCFATNNSGYPPAGAHSVKVSYRWRRTDDSVARWLENWVDDHLRVYAQKNHHCERQQLRLLSKSALEIEQVVRCPCLRAQHGPTRLQELSQKCEWHAGAGRSMALAWKPQSFTALRALLRDRHFLFVGDSLLSGQARVLMHQVAELCASDNGDMAHHYGYASAKNAEDAAVYCPSLNSSASYIRSNTHHDERTAAGTVSGARILARLSDVWQREPCRLGADVALGTTGNVTSATGAAAGTTCRGLAQAWRRPTLVIVSSFIWYLHAEQIQMAAAAAGHANHSDHASSPSQSQSPPQQTWSTANAVEMAEALLQAPAAWEAAMVDLQARVVRDVGSAPQVALQVPIAPLSCADRAWDTRYYLRAAEHPSSSHPAAWELCSVLRAQLSLELQLVSVRRGWAWLDAEPLMQQLHVALDHAAPLSTSTSTEGDADGVSRESLYVHDHLHPCVPMVPLAWNLLLAASLVQPQNVRSKHESESLLVRSRVQRLVV